jgi:tRNA-intron endonuclease
LRRTPLPKCPTGVVSSFWVKPLYNISARRIPDFDKLYVVYKDLRDKGFIVRSGLKFGSDYSLYRLGPGIDHAPFLIHVFGENSLIDPIEIVRAGRLSHSVKKRFILGVVGRDGVKYIAFKWFKP